MLKRVLKPFCKPKYNANNRKVGRDYISVKKFFNIQEGFSVSSRIEMMIKVWLALMPGITFDVEVRLGCSIYLFIFFLSCIFKNMMLGWMHFRIFFVELN